MAHRFHDVAAAGFALGADHGGALVDAAERFAQIPRAADEGRAEVVLQNVVRLVRRSQHLAFVDEVHAQRFQHPGLHVVPDADLGHDRNGNGLLYALDDLDGAHARHAAFLADVGRHPLQRHHRGGARVLGNLRLFRRGHVHDHAALEHLGEPDLDFERPRVAALTRRCVTAFTVAHCTTP